VSQPEQQPARQQKAWQTGREKQFDGRVGEFVNERGVAEGSESGIGFVLKSAEKCLCRCECGFEL
jgi:hypothetical protein